MCQLQQLIKIRYIILLYLMTDFFSKTDLSRKDAENIISETLNKCDDGELYLENSKSESISA